MKEYFNESRQKIKKKWKFHQFIHVEEGYKNSAILDFSKGVIYHTKNEIIHLFKQDKFGLVSDFLDSAIKEKLVISVDEKKWIPCISFEKIDEVKIFDVPFVLGIENGACLDLIKEKFENSDIKKIFFIKGEKHKEIFPLSTKEKITLSFDSCIRLCKEGPFLTNIKIATYEHYMNYNPCWGRKIVITKENNVKPCYFSDISAGNIEKDNTIEILNRIKKYWRITKDKIDRCKDCEFRYVCFDCREISRKKGGNLYSYNPYCRYNPYDGVWLD